MNRHDSKDAKEKQEKTMQGETGTFHVCTT